MPHFIRRASRQAAALVLPLLMAIPFVTAARAADTVITFDDIAADTFLTPQNFHDRGVDFGLPPYASLPPGNQVPSMACCTPITRAPPPGHSSQVASISFASTTEFWISGMFGSFSTWRQHVQVTIGNISPADTSQVTLWAFDINGMIVGAPATASFSGSPVTLSVSAPGPTPVIAYFAIQSADYNKSLWVDDLTFDNPAAPAPADFAFDVQGYVWPGSALTVYQGGSFSTPLPLRRFNGSNGDITLSAPSLPVGVTASFSPNPLPGTTTQTTMTLSAAPDAPTVDNVSITLRGTPAGSAVGPAPRTAQLLINVRPPIIIGTDEAGETIDFPPCLPLTTHLHVLKDTSGALVADTALSLRAWLGSGQTGDLPFGLQASFSPPVSPQGTDFTIHKLTLFYDASSGLKPQALVVVGTSGLVSVLSEPFTVRPIPGVINRVTPGSGSIPNSVLSQLGTSVTIAGEGFCPGTQVGFGNGLATVFADSVSPTRIVATVPLLATEGPAGSPTITLVEKGAPDLSGPPGQKFFVDSIRNSTGFSFHNYTPHTTFGQLTAAYGSDQTEFQIPLCWPIDCNVTFRDPIALFWLNWMKSWTDTHGGGGACFGIALAAARLDAGHRARSDFPPPNAFTNFELDAPDGPSGALTEYINSQVTVQISVEVLSDYLNQSNNTVIGNTSDVLHQIHNKIHDALQAGEKPIIGLQFGNGLFDGGHAVTAYDIQDISTDPIEYVIRVYDPNVQFCGKTAGICTVTENSASGDEHKAALTGSQIHVAPDGTWGLQNGTPMPSGDIGTLFVFRASNIPDPPTLAGAQAAQLSHLTIFGTAGPPASRTTQLADNAGHSLFAADGTLNTDRATRLFAAPFAPFTTNAGLGEAFLAGPKTGPLVQSVVGTRAGSDTHLFTGAGMTARVDTQAAAGVADQIGFDPTGTISFATRAAHKPFTMGLITHGDPGVQAVQIETTSVTGAPDEMQFDKTRTSITLRHGGPAAPLRLRMAVLAPKGGPLSFDSGRLRIPGGAVATFTPSDWTDLKNVVMHVTDPAGNERFTVLGNHPAVNVQGRIVALDIDRVRDKPRERTLEVTSRIGKLPADAEVALAWVARTGGHILANGTRVLGESEVHEGLRHDRFAMVLPADGQYETEVKLVIRATEGIIPETHTSARTVEFRVGRERGSRPLRVPFQNRP
jgi:hypothetical protein